MSDENDEALRKAIDEYHKWRNSRLQRFLNWWRYRKNPLYKNRIVEK